MTIKRRLFISNIMMIAIPALISLSFAAVMLFASMSVLDIKDRTGDGRSYEDIVEQVRKYAQNLEQSDNTTDIEQIKSDINSIVSPQSGGINHEDYYRYIIDIVIFMFIVIIFIILMTNRFLTRMVIKSIVTPLDTLVYGVHQIRDGNLSYRIKYEGKDEFAPVCADFNEMAERLTDMVNARQKDEETRRELIAGISHDLRTPLTSIKTYVEGIELGMASSPQIKKRYFDTIKNKTEDLEHIINQLFLFSKLDTGEFPMQIEKIYIGKWIAGFIDVISDEYAQKGLQIGLEENENIKGIVINADNVQLGNVLTNILENSLKYGDKDGDDKITVQISCHSGGADIVIALNDNGPGVPDDVLKKIFNVFYRGDKSRSNPSQGSGLGLAISAKIIERLGGTIRAENVRESGLSVIITLPVAENREREERTDNL
ncbi:MAG: HAMP domain-containing histidine kinase [Oscillospiraceae bacterium]|nr:HAMP domain-containing histidine kinase [Oscillospiraceae bacterium]